jgi:predicted lactoylglutathione lyase
MKQSVSLITLGVSDYEKGNAFYAALGWQPVLEIDETAFVQANGVVLVLWAREKLAADSGIADDGARRGGITLAHNVASAEVVSAVIERAREAGGSITREPSETLYGGHAGVFRDPDGHAWEIAHNPASALPPTAASSSAPRACRTACREPNPMLARRDSLLRKGGSHRLEVELGTRPACVDLTVPVHRAARPRDGPLLPSSGCGDARAPRSCHICSSRLGR